MSVAAHNAHSWVSYNFVNKRANVASLVIHVLAQACSGCQGTLLMALLRTSLAAFGAMSRPSVCSRQPLQPPRQRVRRKRVQKLLLLPVTTPRAALRRWY